MKAQELIEKLKTVSPDTDIIIRWLNGNVYGSTWIDTTGIDEDNIAIENYGFVIDISSEG